MSAPITERNFVSHVLRILVNAVVAFIVNDSMYCVALKTRQSGYWKL